MYSLKESFFLRNVKNFSHGDTTSIFFITRNVQLRKLEEQTNEGNKIISNKSHIFMYI